MATSDFIVAMFAVAGVLATMHRVRSRPAVGMTWWRARRLALVLSAAAAMAVAPAVGAAATSLVALALLGFPPDVAAVRVPPPTGQQHFVNAAAARGAGGTTRYVELDNGKGVVVFRMVNGVMSTRLKLYRQGA